MKGWHRVAYKLGHWGLGLTMVMMAGVAACSQQTPQVSQVRTQGWRATASHFDTAGVSRRYRVVRLKKGAQLPAVWSQGGMRVVDSIKSLGVSVVDLGDASVMGANSLNLSANAAVLWSHPLSEVKVEKMVSDPMVPKQTHLRLIKAFEAWDVTMGFASVPLAIVDTGISTTHPEFAGKIHPAAYNVLDDNRSPDDDYGHGNHCAGIAGAMADNGIGVAGVAPAVSLMPVKVMDSKGRGDDATIAKGIVYAADNGAKVISMSFGLYRRSPVVEDALQYALDRDIVLVASAGNDNKRNDPDRAPHLPSTHPGVIEVAATTDADRKARFSNYGATVSVAAPGERILSTYREKFGSYGVFTGTSMATPQVAALASMIRGLHPDWNQARVKAHIEATADDLGKAGKDEQFGAGRINCARAVAR